jgi:hypothetical protein
LLLPFIECFLVLHPRHKLHYFKTAGWEKTWIEAAKTIVREEFDRTYAFMDIESNVEPIKVRTSLSANISHTYLTHHLAAGFGITEYV